MATEIQYTSQLAAGMGMVPETLELLRLWEPGMNPAQLVNAAVEEGVFSRATARRTRNIVAEMFAPRFLVSDGTPAARVKFLVNGRIHYDTLSQLCFLYTCRAQRILADFVIEVYWQKYCAGASALATDDAKSFIYRALDSGRMVSRWSDSTIQRQAGYLVGCCLDFGLLSKGKPTARTIQRFAIRPDVALYLVHDLHFAGYSELSIVEHPDWRLFGLEPQEIVGQIRKLADDGHLLVQTSGELIQISWKYKSMEDCLNALIKR